MKNEYDVIIIGGGPAGMSAAIYASRRSLKTLVLTSDIGGQIAKSDIVENYPGVDSISGINLGMSFYNQAKKFGTTVLFEETKEILKKDKTFEVKTHQYSYHAKSIILAFGKKPRKLEIPGEEELIGRGVSYCATCDAPFFKDKIVAIVGGGNSALDAALLSAHYAEKVYLIYRGNAFRAEQILIDKVHSEKKINVLMDSQVTEIIGKGKVEEIKLNTGQNLKVNGIIIEIGFIVDRKLIENLVKIDEANQVIITTHQETSVPGIFAAGDLTTTPYKQVVISAGEGAKAALACFEYLQKQSGKKAVVADWH